jgi:hypothetical protein
LPCGRLVSPSALELEASPSSDPHPAAARARAAAATAVAVSVFFIGLSFDRLRARFYAAAVKAG